jgi:uncharacterized membrane protein YiaA
LAGIESACMHMIGYTSDLPHFSNNRAVLLLIVVVVVSYILWLTGILKACTYSTRKGYASVIYPICVFSCRSLHKMHNTHSSAAKTTKCSSALAARVDLVVVVVVVVTVVVSYYLVKMNRIIMYQKWIHPWLIKQFTNSHTAAQ